MIGKRDWELIQTTVLESAYEQMAARGQLIESANGNISELFRKTVVHVFKCRLTGKIRKEVTVSQ